jgi:hypothetical protein
MGCSIEACRSQDQLGELAQDAQNVRQQGRSECSPEAYPLGYVEDLHEARTPLADFFSILLCFGFAVI